MPLLSENSIKLVPVVPQVAGSELVVRVSVVCVAAALLPVVTSTCCVGTELFAPVTMVFEVVPTTCVDVGSSDDVVTWLPPSMDVVRETGTLEPCTETEFGVRSVVRRDVAKLVFVL